MSRNGALKVLDYALSGPEGRNNCNKFVDIFGLRTLFPLFMKKPKRNKSSSSCEEQEEHVCSIIASLLRNCNSQLRQRILTKFSENEYEKVERLLELHLKYLHKVEKGEALCEDQDLEDQYLKRLSSGLFTLHLIDFIILEVAAASDLIKQRIFHILNLRKSSPKIIKTIMREYAGNLGDAGDNSWHTDEVNHIIDLIDRF